MSSSYSDTKPINFSKGGQMDKSIEVYNYDSKGNPIDPNLIVIRIKIIYDLIKKYIKEEND